MAQSFQLPSKILFKYMFFPLLHGLEMRKFKLLELKVSKWQGLAAIAKAAMGLFSSGVACIHL
jgi:hypothetical protein